MTADDQGAHVNHVDPVSQGGIGEFQGGVLLDHRNAFSSQCRLIDAELVGFNHPGVGRHAVAGAENNQVAETDVLHWDLLALAVPLHSGQRMDNLLQRLDGALGFTFGDITDHCIANFDSQNHHGVHCPAGNHRKSSRHAEQSNGKRHELTGKHTPFGARRRFRKFIGGEFLQSFFRGGLSQADIGGAAEHFQSQRGGGMRARGAPVAREWDVKCAAGWCEIYPAAWHQWAHGLRVGRQDLGRRWSLQQLPRLPDGFVAHTG